MEKKQGKMLKPLNEFIHHIDPKIEERGYNYFIEGAIDALEETVPGVWQSAVYGTVIYTVDIRLEGDQVESWQCTCPYDYGPVCKHVAATLYAIDEKLEAGKSSTTTNNRENGDKPTRVQNVFEKATKQDLEGFILELFNGDSNIKNRFVVYFSEYLDDKDTEQKYRMLIQNSYKSVQDEFGFIDYHSAPSLNRSLDKLTGKADTLLANDDFQESLVICKVLIEEIASIYDYADGAGAGMENTVYFAFETLGKLAGQLPPMSKQALFDWSVQEFPKEKYRNAGFDDDFLFLMPSLISKPNQEERFFELIDRQIEVEKRKTYSNYAVTNLIKAKVNYLQKQDRVDDAADLIEACNHYPDFRELQIDRAIDAKNFETAKDLCTEGIEIAKDQQHRGTVNRWEEKLFEVARAEENPETMQKWAEILFISRRFNMNWFRELKNVWPEDTWPEKCESLINVIKGENERGGYSDAEALAEIFIEEGYTGRLLKLIQINPGNINLVRYCSDHLAEEYPCELLDLYEAGIKKHARQTGRKKYRETGVMLLEMKAIMGGDEQAYKLFRWLLKEYNNRPAMKDELGKAFPEWISG